MKWPFFIVTLLILATASRVDSSSEGKSLIFGELIRIKNLPPAGSISNILLNRRANASHETYLDVEIFRSLFKKATPVDPEQADSWHYAPWYSGTFTYKGGTYNFLLYLGGRGLLTYPDGKKGLFSFEHPK